MCKSFFFLLLCTFLLTISLNCGKNEKLPIVRTTLRPEPDGIVRDIPKERRGYHHRQMQQKADSSLGLPSLQNGFNGLQVRIWTGTGLTYMGRLFVIETDKRTWKGDLSYFRDTFNQQYAGATLIEKTALHQSDREWKQLITDLFTLGIDTLPDYTLLPKYSLDTDEGGVLIEVAQDRFYKSYQYPTPTTRIKEFKEAKQVTQIVDLIDKTFGNKLDDPTYGVQHRLSAIQAED